MSSCFIVIDNVVEAERLLTSVQGELDSNETRSKRPSIM